METHLALGKTQTSLPSQNLGPSQSTPSHDVATSGCSSQASHPYTFSGVGQGLVLHLLNVKAHKTHSPDGSLEAPSVGLRKEEVPLYPSHMGVGIGHRRGRDGQYCPLSSEIFISSFSVKVSAFVYLHSGCFSLLACHG